MHEQYAAGAIRQRLQAIGLTGQQLDAAVAAVRDGVDPDDERIVITGMGVAAPLGVGVPTFWSNMLAGKSGVGPCTLYDIGDAPVRIAAPST